MNKKIPTQKAFESRVNMTTTRKNLHLFYLKHKRIFWCKEAFKFRKFVCVNSLEAER